MNCVSLFCPFRSATVRSYFAADRLTVVAVRVLECVMGDGNPSDKFHRVSFCLILILRTFSLNAKAIEDDFARHRRATLRSVRANWCVCSREGIEEDSTVFPASRH